MCLDLEKCESKRNGRKIMNCLIKSNEMIPNLFEVEK